NGYEADGPYLTAGYNPPWTLPMSRRNEVLIPVKAKK
ncbi:MAG: heme-binding protein, partial [Pseudomonadota bacterium]